MRVKSAKALAYRLNFSRLIHACNPSGALKITAAGLFLYKGKDARTIQEEGGKLTGLRKR
jgi:hypothetical protein